MSASSANRATLETKRRFRAWLMGAIGGALFWAAAFVLLLVVMDKLNRLYPSSDFVEILQRIVAIIAIPFFFFAFEIWGDELPWWIGILDIPFCLCFYSLLGGLVGRSISKSQRWLFTLRTLLIVTSVVAVLLGIAVYLDD